jgi:iron(III) transport system permease protein
MAHVGAVRPSIGLGRRPLPAWFSLATLGFTLLLGVVALLVVYPIILLLVSSFEVGAPGQQAAWSLDNWRTTLTRPDVQTAIQNTISLSMTRQAIAVVIGVLLAWLLARTDLPGREWLEFGFWIAVFLPSLTVTLGWIMVFDSYKGLANQLLENLPFVQKGPFDVFSWWGIIWVHLMTGTLALKVMLLTPAFRNLDAALEEASQAAGATNLGTLLRIVVPLLAPAILVVLILGMIRSMESFEIELILGAPAKIDVYSTLIYRLALQDRPQYGVATVLSMAILLLAIPFIGFQQWYSGHHSSTTVSGRFRQKLNQLGRWRWPLFGVVLFLVLLMTALPILLVIAATFMKLFGFFTIPDPWTGEHWQTVLANRNFANSLVNSLVISTGTALLAMGAFFAIAYVIVRTTFFARGLLDVLVWLPSTLPGIILGLGYLWLFLGTPFLRPLYGTTAILVVVAALGSMTLTTQIVKASLLQLGSELEEASWASGASWWYTARRVVLPLIAPTLAAVGVLAFSASARATSHVALLSTQGNRPLSMLQLDLMADNNFEAASVIGVFILLLTVGVAVGARLCGLRLGLGGSR